MNKAVLILSGGLDSTCLLAKLIKDGFDVECLSFDYGQRHHRELNQAGKITQHYALPHQVLDLSDIGRFLKGSSQTDNEVPVPHGHYAAENMKLTVVPNRNMIMLSIAAAYAMRGWCCNIGIKAEAVAFACHAGDHTIYPDCRLEFVEALEKALLIGNWDHVRIWAPFIKMTKAELLRVGYDLGAPLELTYSCYEGREFHCGKCGTCVERKEAFQVAGIPDPTTYQVEEGCSH